MNDYRLPPTAHQLVGIEKLVAHPVFALFDVPGTGKSKQIIDASQILYLSGTIDRVVVVCPSSVRDVWFDEQLGELAKHLWTTVPNLITEYHARRRQWKSGPESDHPLKWVITNFDFIRERGDNMDRLKFLLRYCDQKTWLVIDESSAVKNAKSAQFKACMALRKVCGRIALLNGTPVADNPGDMFAQGNLMDPAILDCKYISYFQARYACMKPVLGHSGKVLLDPRGQPIKSIAGWTNLENLQERFRPYVLRRTKSECMDLPPQLPPVTLSVPLSEPLWRIYKSMRDEMVSWISERNVSVAGQAIVKIMRLSQITSGWLGGVEDEETDILPPDLLDSIEYATDYSDDILKSMMLADTVETTITRPTAELQEIGREKLDFFLEWLDDRLRQNPKFKAMVFSRFRPDLDRAMAAVADRGISVGMICGGQKRTDRLLALRLLDPRTTPDGPVLVGAMPGAGSLGINATAADTIIRLSNNYSLYQRSQGDDRIHRRGQVRPVSYYDIMATGPQGQRTIDHAILAALAAKQNLAEWTTAAWITALRAE
jgi:SNF2 family DNA or RNA helicase